MCALLQKQVYTRNDRYKRRKWNQQIVRWLSDNIKEWMAAENKYFPHVHFTYYTICNQSIWYHSKHIHGGNCLHKVLHEKKAHIQDTLYVKRIHKKRVGWPLLKGWSKDNECLEIAQEGS